MIIEWESFKAMTKDKVQGKPTTANCIGDHEQCCYATAIQDMNRWLKSDECKKKVAKIITASTLWNLGADSHQALSELTESITKELSQ